MAVTNLDNFDVDSLFDKPAKKDTQSLSYTVTEKVVLPGTLAHGSIVMRKIIFKTTKMANDWYEQAKKMSDGLFRVVNFERDN